MGTVPAGPSPPCHFQGGLRSRAKCEMGTVPRAKGGLRSCAAAEERDPPHFVRQRPPPPGYKSSILTFGIAISSPPSLSAHLQLISSSSTAHLQLIYLSLICGNI